MNHIAWSGNKEALYVNRDPLWRETITNYEQSSFVWEQSHTRSPSLYKYNVIVDRFYRFFLHPDPQSLELQLIRSSSSAIWYCTEIFKLPSNSHPSFGTFTLRQARRSIKRHSLSCNQNHQQPPTRPEWFSLSQSNRLLPSSRFSPLL